MQNQPDNFNHLSMPTLFVGHPMIFGGPFWPSLQKLSRGRGPIVERTIALSDASIVDKTTL